MNLPMKQKQTRRHRDRLVVAKGMEAGGGKDWSLGLVDANYYI